MRPELHARDTPAHRWPKGNLSQADKCGYYKTSDRDEGNVAEFG